MTLIKIVLDTIEISEIPNTEFLKAKMQYPKGHQVFHYSLTFNGITVIVGGGTKSEPLVLINHFFKTFDEVAMYLELIYLREEG